MIVSTSNKSFWQNLFWQKIAIIAVLLLASATLCQTSFSQENSLSEKSIAIEQAAPTAETSLGQKRAGFWQKKLHWLTPPDQGKPIVLDNNLRRPFLFFRDAINQSWPLGRLFFVTLLSACLAKLFAANMVAGALERCRRNFLICIASAFLYTTILLSLSRLAFQTEALIPMALGCIALVQLSYIVGMGLGVNIFANIINGMISKRFGQTSAGNKRSAIGCWLALFATVTVLTAISAIPELGRLPRLGNRLVVLVAIIGLGGLISDLRTKSRNRESE